MKATMKAGMEKLKAGQEEWRPQWGPAKKRWRPQINSIQSKLEEINKNLVEDDLASVNQWT
jgi:hypothetical protein